MTDIKKIHEDHNGVTVFTNNRYPGHDYRIGANAPAASIYRGVHRFTPYCKLVFQSGPVKTSGVNGITSEALLAVLIDRTTVLNDKFPCKENEDALAYLKGALEAFESRTKDRIERNVEGKNEL